MTNGTITTDYKYMYQDDNSVGASDQSMEIHPTTNDESPSRKGEATRIKPSSGEQQDSFSVNSYGDNDMRLPALEEELWWSMTSNLFFIAGSISYVILAFWEDVPAFTYSVVVGLVVEWAGPIIYMVNSTIDVYFAHFLATKAKTQRQLSRRLLGMPPKKKARGSLMTNSLKKIRKHAAHRRSLMAALTFGLAAFLAVIDLCFYYFGNYEKTIIIGSDRGIADALSVHMYLVSAAFAVTGRRERPRTWQFSLLHPDNLEDLGDLFFLIGSLVDVVLCDYHFDDNTSFWSTLSSFLWFFDACFYLRSDLLTKSVYVEVALLQRSGHLSLSSSGSSTQTILKNRLCKVSGDRDADERLATYICNQNESMV